MSISASIYIPRMSVNTSGEEFIRQAMEIYKIGSVSHIDFTPINKKRGFRETVGVDQVVVSAFVYFSSAWLCSDNVYRFKDEAQTRNNKFWDTIASGQLYKLQLSPNEYWLCFKNINPIPRTMMNIHQVVENGRYLEGLIEEQARMIKEQAKLIQEQAKKIEVLESKLQTLEEDMFTYKLI